MLTHEQKYKDWVLGYCDAWVQRARDNNGIIPSNIGLDGKIGGAADGKWYGGAYGWGFSPIVPMTGKRDDRNRVPRAFVGFMNAYLLSKGDDKYLDVVAQDRRQDSTPQAKTVDGKLSSPTMFGDQGWYSFKPGKYRFNFLEIYHLSMKPSDRARCEDTEWYSFLEGKNPGYPVKALRAGLARIRNHMEHVDKDSTSPDMRLADSALDYNPASVTALTQLIEAGLYIQHPGWARTTPGQGGSLLFCRLRYFDPSRRRAGLPARCRGAGGQLESRQPDRDPGQCQSQRGAQRDRAGRRLWRAPDRLGVRRQGDDTGECAELPGAAGAGLRRQADHPDEALRQ